MHNIREMDGKLSYPIHCVIYQLDINKRLWKVTHCEACMWHKIWSGFELKFVRMGIKGPLLSSLESKLILPR